MKPQRSFATVLFTDIVSSTERATELRDASWGELRRKHDALVRRELRRFGGREVKNTGDGFLAVFAGPAQGVACAAAIRDAVRGLGLEIRAGLHIGEVEEARSDVAGVVVHVAARVMGVAGAGEILLSSTVRDALGGSRFEFRDRGVHDLKGIPDEWRLYAVAGVPDIEHEPHVDRWLSRARKSNPLLVGTAALLVLFLLAALYVGRRGDRNEEPNGEIEPVLGAAPGIAVLPFMVRGPGLDIWREGMVDVLSTNLDGVAGLRAIDSRTVLARVREHSGDRATADGQRVLEIGRAAKARYVVTGSAVGAPPQLRLAADVYDVRTGGLLGRAHADGPPDSLLALVDRLAVGVLRTIVQEREGGIVAPSISRVTTSSLPALKAYVEGETAFRRSDFEAAAVAYQRALEADSVFGLALYRLSQVYDWTGRWEHELAVEYAKRAARMSNKLPDREATLLRAALAYNRGTLEGIELLRRAVQRYPDDAEAWYLLGESYWHLGEQALVDYREVDVPFVQATTLDPQFGPAYIHLIHRSFLDADSARALELMQRYRTLAPESPFNRDHALAFALAFGAPSARKEVLAQIDSLSVETLHAMSWTLWHPRFLEAQEPVFVALARRPGVGARFMVSLMFNRLQQGKLTEALRGLEDSLFPSNTRAAFLYELQLLGFPMPTGILERHLSVEDAPRADESEFPMFHAGAYAADRGRWNDHARAVDVLREVARANALEGDSLTSTIAEGGAQALEAYGRMLREADEDSIRALAAAQQKATSFVVGLALNRTMRWWLGLRLVELGRMAEAARYVGSFYNDPVGAYYHARVLERLGDAEGARARYEYFAVAWRSADPELQPMVEEARAAVKRLRGVVP